MNPFMIAFTIRRSPVNGQAELLGHRVNVIDLILLGCCINFFHLKLLSLMWTSRSEISSIVIFQRSLECAHKFWMIFFRTCKTHSTYYYHAADPRFEYTKFCEDLRSCPCPNMSNSSQESKSTCARLERICQAWKDGQGCLGTPFNILTPPMQGRADRVPVGCQFASFECCNSMGR
ncbi:hypothetical protein EDC04DRAFT_415892 [Pisolithus marmoratus]|nr:hypothetical protein EDC04DRAFT_415892 [Pisolithus marmoratus]